MPRAARSTSAHLAPARSGCPVARCLDLLGDRWTLLVLRDLFFGRKRFGEFLASPEGIPTNILADRLKRLCDAGLVAAAPYQAHPPRMDYTLTERGAELRPVLRALVDWGQKHFPESDVALVAQRGAPERPKR